MDASNPSDASEPSEASQPSDASDASALSIDVEFVGQAKSSMPPPLPSKPPTRREPPWSPSRPDLAAGSLVGGIYRLSRKLGAGGMGEVWAAEHVRLRKQVAIKVLLPHAQGEPEVVARFEREAILLGRVEGDHAPYLLDFVTDDVYGPALVTELVNGESLADVLDGPVSVEEAVQLGIEVADALTHLHRAGVVHRDLKPSNVILRRGADGVRQATILDLGVSCLVAEKDDAEVADLTGADRVLGTMEYMAPEQIVCCGRVTPGADLYSLGAILFRAITGAPVFGPGLSRLDLVHAKLTMEAPALPTARTDPRAHGFAELVARALARKPEQRYESAEALKAALVAVKALAGVACVSDSVAEPAREPTPESTPADAPAYASESAPENDPESESEPIAAAEPSSGSDVRRSGTRLVERLRGQLPLDVPPELPAPGSVEGPSAAA
ncbi:MAG TPA: serine/threonine-protein kinase [Polyangiaceae bacterium]